jgi:hypothetical protein
MVKSVKFRDPQDTILLVSLVVLAGVLAMDGVDYSKDLVLLVAAGVLTKVGTTGAQPAGESVVAAKEQVLELLARVDEERAAIDASRVEMEKAQAAYAYEVELAKADPALVEADAAGEAA